MRCRALFGAVLVGVTACASRDVPVAPELPLGECVCRGVTVSPSSAVLIAGDRLTLSSSLTNQGGVRWSSSNPAVASVDSMSGVVLAKSQGTATIIATSAVDPAVKGGALITVLSMDVGLPGIVINSITQVETGTPANLAAMFGANDVELKLGGITKPMSVELIVNNGTVDSIVATAQSGSAPPASWTVRLRWNTAARTSTGARVFPNGRYTLRARALEQGSTASWASTTQSVTVNNP